MDNETKVLIMLIVFMIIGAMLSGLSFDLGIVTLGFIGITIFFIGLILFVLYLSEIFD